MDKTDIVGDVGFQMWEDGSGRGTLQALGRGDNFLGVVRRVSAEVRLPGFKSWLSFLSCLNLGKLYKLFVPQLPHL